MVQLQVQSTADNIIQDQDLTTTTTNSSLLVVGSYCHDVLFHNGQFIAETLGGAASFISNIIHSLLSPHIPTTFISKVGADFSYSASIHHPYITSTSSPTTVFHAHFNTYTNNNNENGSDRILRRFSACDPIYASDLPSESFGLGLAAGVAGEILLETLDQMCSSCNILLVDVQGLIRSFDQTDGTVRLVPLGSTRFSDLLPRIHFLKVSSEEAPFVDVEEVRKKCCVIVTEGKDGCSVYWGDDGGEVVHVEAFDAVQVDPTGAGDSFLGGFVVGLISGLSVPDAALVGNFFGAITVGQIGVPEFDPRMLKGVNEILERKGIQRRGSHLNGTAFNFEKSSMHDELQASLQEASRFFYCKQLTDHAIDHQET